MVKEGLRRGFAAFDVDELEGLRQARVLSLEILLDVGETLEVFVLPVVEPENFGPGPALVSELDRVEAQADETLEQALLDVAWD